MKTYVIEDQSGRLHIVKDTTMSPDELLSLLKYRGAVTVHEVADSARYRLEDITYVRKEPKPTQPDSPHALRK